MPTAIRPADLDLLRWCHELRFCTIDHLTALTGRHRQALNLRLRTLIQEKYVYRTAFPNPNQKHVYSLGTQGFRHLAYAGVIRLTDVPVRLRTSELKPFFLDHTLLVTDIHATLILASRESEKRVTDWREGRELYDSVTFYENGRKKRLPVCPDAFFSLETNCDPKTRTTFALEADRGTTTRRTFEGKLNGYWRFLEQNRQIKSYGVKWFRIVTVTLTDARAQGLAVMASDTIPDRLKKYFLFASREHFSLERPAGIYASVFQSAKPDSRIAI
ncbi:MAG: hypothetical protein UZ17_ACD001000693 [Acidobacteria bacterium OLB17]|nr:MAG: hypothetical protein UZ17_ACD001000693 [Acidobacteria bacterium OLB17]MCZ2390338.1 replication-relaxation family protein [Acidobacteriota bacterium]